MCWLAGQHRTGDFYAWVGAVKSNIAPETSPFVWDHSGTPVLDSLWCEGEPNNANNNEDHVMLEVKLTQGTVCLNDNLGSRGFTYICETPC